MNEYITYFEIAALLASLIAIPKLQRKKFMLLFPLLLSIIVTVEVHQTFFREHGSVNNTMIYNVQVPLQYVIYLTILYHAITKRSVRKWIIFSILFYILFSVITTNYYLEQGKWNVLSYSLGSVMMIVGILIKFYEMLESPTEFNFLRNPFFFILFAFLLFNVGTLPYFAMGNWLYYVRGDHQSVIILSNVMSILNYILYSTYTISFIWMRVMKESY